MSIDTILEEINKAGFVNVEYTSTDCHASYYEGKRHGTKYEFKTCHSEFHDELELHGRHAGKEDWFFMFDILEDDGWGGKY